MNDESLASSNQKFYGISVSEPGKQYKGEPFVFSNLSDALAFIKKFPGSRFKVFKSYEDAVAYATDSIRSSSSESDASYNARRFLLKKNQELCLWNLYRAIKSANETDFYNLVWSNPQCLVNLYDCPTILEADTHFNALHIAAKNLQTDLFVAVLNTLYNLRFMELLYPQTVDPLILEVKQKRIMDLYLNTPDILLGETALHHACKFGAYEIVKIALSCEWTDKEKRNKYDKRPFDIICDCVNSQIPDDKLKSNIQRLFEDSIYVPILRDVNNAFEATVGDPCQSCLKEDIITRGVKVIENNLLPYAFVGPMSMSNAKTFYLACKRKKFSDIHHYSMEVEKEFIKICRTDPIKGIERVLRKISKDSTYEWIEFWPIFGLWINLASDHGLRFLECHLRCQTDLKLQLQCKQMNMDQRCDCLISFLENGLVHSFCKIATQIIEQKQNFITLFQLLIPEMNCMTNFTFSNSEFLNDIHEEIAQIICQTMICHRTISKSVLHAFIMQMNAKLDFANGFSIAYSKNWEFLLCIARFVIFFYHRDQTYAPIISFPYRPICSCNWLCEAHLYSFDSKTVYDKFVTIRQDIFNNMCLSLSVSAMESLNSVVEAGFIASSQPFSSPSFELDLKSQFERISESSKSSYIAEKCAPDVSSSDDEFFTPPETPLAENSVTTHLKRKYHGIYMKGSEISEDDIDIFRAVESIPINSFQYPNLYKWKVLMESELQKFFCPVNVFSQSPTAASSTLRRLITEVGNM